MIEEMGEVVAIRGDQAMVHTARRSTCGGCAARSGCGTGVLSRWVGRRQAVVAVPNRLGAAVGDRVRLGLPEGSLVRGAATLYLLPLAGLLAGGIAVESLARGPEALTVLGAAAGFVAALMVARLRLAAGRRAAGLQPVMLERLPARPAGLPGLLAP